MTNLWEGIERAAVEPGAVFREAGDVDAGMSKASKRLRL